MDTSAKSMMEFFEKAGPTGRMKASTAHSFAAPCRQIFKIDENWEQIDVSKLDIDEFLTRFRNLNHLNYKTESLAEYERRFRRAISLYLSYVQDPKGWRFTGVASSNQKTNGQNKPVKPKSKAKQAGPSSQNGNMQQTLVDSMEASPVGITPSGIQLMDFPYPLREGCVVKLRLPLDLKTAEVERLAAYMKTLTVDFAVA